MLRRTLAIGSALGLLLGLVATVGSADATDSLDNVVSHVVGDVVIDVDDDGDGNPWVNGDPTDIVDDPDELCEVDGEAGDKAQFAGITIRGLFVAGGIAGYAGEVGVDTVNVCVVPGEMTPVVQQTIGPEEVTIERIPLTTSGELEQADFRGLAPQRNPLSPNQFVCLFGTLQEGGIFEGAGAVLSRAFITADYEIHSTVDNDCDETAQKGTNATLIAKATSVLLEAETAAAPAGTVADRIPGGSELGLPDKVSAQVHTVHQSAV